MTKHMVVVFVFLLLSSTITVCSFSSGVQVRASTGNLSVHRIMLNPTDDTFVDGKYHWTDKGSSDSLWVWAFDNIYISFLRFDLSDIPSSAQIVSADLFVKVTMSSVDSNDPSIIGVHHYSNDSWNEDGLTWDTVDWGALNETAIDTTEIYVDILQFQEWFNWTITDIVENEWGNYLSVVLKAENNVESISFSSKEGLSKPYLEIKYSPRQITLLTPTDDTFVRSDQDWRNFGYGDYLWTSSSKTTFLKFRLINIPSSADVISAKLRLCLDENMAGENISVSSHLYSNDSWDEDNLTHNVVDWNSISPSPSDSVGVYYGETWTWKEWNVTEYVMNYLFQNLSIALKSASGSCFFSSKERLSGIYSPELEIVYEVKPVHNLDTGLNYTTIQAAIDANETLDGHTIFVEEGIYYENVVLNKTLTLVGENRNTIIDGSYGTQSPNGFVVQVSANNATIKGFTIQNGPNGLEIYGSNNTIIRNTVTNMRVLFDIKVNGNFTVIGHNTIANSSAMYSIKLSVSKNSVISNNTISNLDAGYVSVGFSEKSVISNNLMNNTKGILVTSNNTIISNNILRNVNRIQLSRCYFSSISDNVIMHSSKGILLSGFSQNNTVSGNSIFHSLTGIRLDPYYGVAYLLEYPPYEPPIPTFNKVIGNTIMNNSKGLVLRNSYQNFVYHNNFVNNTQQVLTELWDYEYILGGYRTRWDNGYPSGGNYWSNYTGVDSNHDGIGDGAHIIEQTMFDDPWPYFFGHIDYYPLMGMLSSFNTSLGYPVNVISNSTIEDFHYFESNGTIRMHVSNMTATQTYGFVRVCIPHALMNVSNISVVIDNGLTPVLHFNYALYDNGTHRWIYFAYEHSRHEIVIQEDTAPPAITIVLPENKTYTSTSIPLNFIVNEQTSWIGHSLDGAANVTITGNTTLNSLLDGPHYVVIYANDTVGNMGASNTVYFTVDTTPPNITDVSQTPLEPTPEDEVKVNATVIDYVSGVKQVILNYTNGNGTWITVDMTNLEGNLWNGTIPAFPYGTNVTYIIIAEDNANNTITTEEMEYEYQYHVIPEFPSALILPLLMISTLVAVVLMKVLWTEKKRLQLTENQ